jgi:maleate isomerase
MENYAGLGLRCVAERHLNDPGNFSFSKIGSDTIAEMVRDVAKASPQAIAIVCTICARPPGRGARARTGILVLDSTAVVVWKSLRLAGVDPRRVQGWGRLFQTPG